MAHFLPSDIATSVLAWSTNASRSDLTSDEDLAGEVDEPPEPKHGNNVDLATFRRTSIPRPYDRRQSLLTTALHAPVEIDSTNPLPGKVEHTRRRSFTSNLSAASTVDLTSDAGISTPARTETPSPRLPDYGLVPLLPLLDKDADQNILQIVGSVPARPVAEQVLQSHPSSAQQTLGQRAEEAPVKKRCITFACAANPRKQESEAGLAAVVVMPQAPSVIALTPQQPRRSCIRFACGTRPVQATTHAQTGAGADAVQQSQSDQLVNNSSPVSVRRLRSSSRRSSRSVTPRRTPLHPITKVDKKYITADIKDMESEPCRFHEFASAQMLDDDWIRREKATETSNRLTIQDTLRKENIIRQLGREAEEEAEEEEDAEEDDDEADGADEDDEEEGEHIDDEENLSGYGSDDDMTDGYNSDEEYGFNDSDAETTGDPLRVAMEDLAALRLSRPSAVRGTSFDPGYSDSSAYSIVRLRTKRSRPKMIGCARPTTPELPDSTDFVCGTFDEDRPLEAAYMSAVASRRHDKLVPIPQDIDPSFPTSDPESEEDEDRARGSHSSIGHGLMHGDFEDIHHDIDRQERLKKKGQRPAHQSPARRYHSPPPKRHPSPAPKGRGRSPRRLTERASPRRTRSPALTQVIASPPASPTLTAHPRVFKSLAVRPGPTHTKSLPRVPSFFPHATKPVTTRRSRANTLTRDKHVRGAIDIVKGLEQKRQRRREKFFQKHCHRARKGHNHHHDKRPQPGKGAERMRELGLIMAGKAGQGGNYVLSI